MPPPGELIFQDPPGDVHIKYGYIAGGDYYVVKIASGFYDNPRHGLPSFNTENCSSGLTAELEAGTPSNPAFLERIRKKATRSNPADPTRHEEEFEFTSHLILNMCV